MKALSIYATQCATPTFALKIIVGGAAALLAAFLFGALLGGDWTLPMDPAVGYAFTA
jgi:hypothetical protein